MEGIISKILNVSEEKIHVIKRLEGGMSNQMYVFSYNDEYYTFRYPGTNSHLFVNREVELHNLQIVSQFPFVNETIYFDEKHGYKIAKYIEGNDLSTIDYKEFLPSIVSVLKSLHSLDVKTNYYEPFARLSLYEQYVSKYLNLSQEYLTVKEKLMNVYKTIEIDKMCFCHGDAQRANWIKGENNQVFLLDYEFSGINDYYYDIACFGNNNMLDAEVLLENYLSKKPSTEQIKRLYMWRAFQGLQWYNVALYKEKSGLSKELKIDFLSVANYFLQMAKDILENIIR